MVIFKTLLWSWIKKAIATKIIKFCYKDLMLCIFKFYRCQLIFAVLCKCPVTILTGIRLFLLIYDFAVIVQCDWMTYPDAPSFSRLSLQSKTLTSETKMNLFRPRVHLKRHYLFWEMLRSLKFCETGGWIQYDFTINKVQVKPSLKRTNKNI